MRRYLPFATLVLTLSIVGCGGGGAGSASSGGEGALGQVVYAVQPGSGMVKPTVVTQNAGALINGLAGANFTKAYIQPVRNLAATQFAYTMGNQLWVANSDFSNPRRLSTLFDTIQGPPSWYALGSLIAVCRAPAYGQAQQIYRVNEDGTGFVKLTSQTNGAYGPAWAPNGGKIAFYTLDSPSQIYVMNLDGSGLLKISDGTSIDRYPFWSPDSKTVYFSRSVSGGWAIYSVPAGGGTSTVYNPGPFNFQLQYAFAPDNSNYTVTTSNVGSLYINQPTGGFQATVPPSGGLDTNPCFSPDGSYIIWDRMDSSGNHSIWRMNSDGTHQVQLSDPTQNVSQAVWGPFPPARSLVGSGAPCGVSAAGFLMGQLGQNVTSFFAFNATTPATAVITAQSSAGAANAAFQISADSVTSIKYMNDMFGGGVTVVPGAVGTTVKGAIVSYDSNTGLVMNVLPYISAKRVVSKTGALAFDGTFVGAWNKDGKNVAPNGAHHVEIGNSLVIY